VRLSVAGRTDRGVHARGQVISFDAPADRFDVAKLRRSIERLSAGAVALLAAEVAAPDFDARFSARWRQYRYVVRASPLGDPFTRTTAWTVGRALDLEMMNEGAAHLVGTHDFASCCRPAKASPGAVVAPTTVRRVLAAEWSEADDDQLHFEIRATAFCHQMVRSIVGMLVDVGRGRMTPESVPGVIAAKHRGAVRTVAPPHGLTLWEVGYDDL